MTLLTNTDLLDIVIDDFDKTTDSSLMISPFKKENLTPVGYDLCVGTDNVVNGVGKDLESGDSLVISPKSMALIHTLEEISMPKNKTLSAIINSKVSLCCKGLSNISTTVDADWKGNLLVAVHNNSNKEITLKHGEAFCTIVFIENKTASTDVRNKKPAGRLDILKDEFKQNTKEQHWWISVVANLIPPLLAFLSLFIAFSLFDSEKQKYAFGSIVTVGVFIAGFSTKFIDPVIKYLNKK